MWVKCDLNVLSSTIIIAQLCIHQKTHTKTDVIMNNLAETFNGYIINTRTKHLIYILENIITTLMYRLVLKRQEMDRSSDVESPRIQAKLEIEKEEVAICFPLAYKSIYI